MFYLVCALYDPNTAPSNRIMAYVRALSELKMKTCVVFFFPDKAHSRVKESFPHIQFKYLWEKGYIDIPRLRNLSLRFYLWRFVRNLKAGDKVYVYGSPDLVVALSKRTDISVYVERTEHDSVSFNCFMKPTTVEDFHNACRVISGIVVISRGLRQFYIDLGCKPDRVHIVNMIADTTRFKDLNKLTHEPYIAYCGTATNTKDGVDLLIKAFAKVVKKYPEYKLYIIGRTPSKKENFDNLDLAKDLGIEHHVIFTGLVPANEMPQMLINAEILALDRPDNIQAKYGFPTKLGEYLLTGNPVVLTRVGDIPLFLKDGESALIAKPNDNNDFASKLIWAIEHPEEAKQIGQRGKIVAENEFNYLIETHKIYELVK